MAKASELLWVFLVGVGNAGGVGQCRLFHGLCGCVVGIL